MKQLICILNIFIILLFQSCFTGIESTPKITLKKNYDEYSTEISDEKKFLSHIKNQPFKHWLKGKEFYVTSDKIALIFSANCSTDSLSGSTIRYEGYTTATSVTGDYSTDIIFSDNNNNIFTYRVNCSPKELNEQENIDIPFTIQTSIIEDVNQLLLNKTFYILTSSWYDLKHNSIAGKKYIPVTISKIEAGNHIYPINITFTDNQNQTHCVYMTVGNEIQSTRNFNTLFSFNDPRNKYPTITDENWDKIVNQSTTIGMTKNECKLALGIPVSVQQYPSNAGVIELWIYENGNRLFFEDGILKEFKQ